MKVIQINTVVNSGSTGRIAEDIGNVLLSNGHESIIAYGRGIANSSSRLIKIGNDWDVYFHGAYTLLTDKHCFASIRSTNKLISQLEKINPDLILIHNLHGYYINIEILFAFIKKNDIPVVWTMHDCWPITGHCSYFDDVYCDKWLTGCNNCPKIRSYPKSYMDNSFNNYFNKKVIFSCVPRLKIITPSFWLKAIVERSFLNYDVKCINNGINLEKFDISKNNDLIIKYNLYMKKVILGCASVWSNRKGYADFVKLSKIVSSDYQIVMIGLNDKEIKSLPKNILGLKRTESIKELAQWYSLAYVFVNPTLQDNFPTTNLEALACGTPVITYNTGGSPETIDKTTGFVVEKGNVPQIVEKINDLNNINYEMISKACRLRAESLYNNNSRYLDYLKVIEELINI